MDFVVSLPSFHGNSFILVVIDRFSQSTYFGMLPTRLISFEVVNSSLIWNVSYMDILKVSYQTGTLTFSANFGSNFSN